MGNKMIAGFASGVTNTSEVSAVWEPAGTVGQQPLSRGPVTNVTRFSREKHYGTGLASLPAPSPGEGTRGCGTGHVVPLRLSLGRNQTHCPLGQCGDRQARIDSEITGQHRAVADVHIAIAKDPMAMVDYAVFR